MHQNIWGAGLTYKLLCWRVAERDEDAREQWKEDVHLNFVAAQMVWTDESSKDDHTIYRHYGWATTGQRATIGAQCVCRERYSILPAMSIDGYIATRIILGSVDAEEFFNFIVEDVVRVYALSFLHLIMGSLQR